MKYLLDTCVVSELIKKIQINKLLNGYPEQLKPIYSYLF